MIFYNFFYELQIRILLLILSSCITLITSYLYKDVIIFNLVKPYLIINKMSSFYFIFTDITEVFSTYLYLCSFITIQSVFFLGIYHISVFLTPGLFLFESQLLKNLIRFNFMGWFCLIIILHKYIIPISCKFFITFQNTLSNDSINFYFEAKINEFLTFYITLYYLLFLILQFFIFIYLILTKYIKILQEIKGFRKNFYFLFFILATLITPPDVLSQLIVCFTIISFYESLKFLSFTRLNMKTVDNKQHVST